MRIQIGKRNILHDLTIDEVSLVDSPANAEIDPITGKKIARAVVAFYKRDTSGNTSQWNKPATAVSKGTNRMTELLTVLKAAKTRRDIETAVTKYAKEIVAKKGNGLSVERVEARLYAENPDIQMAYEAAPVGKAAAYAMKTVEMSHSEALIDQSARRIMKRDGVSYPSAYAQVLEEDPALYQRYERETAAGATLIIEDPEQTGGVSKRAAANLKSVSRDKCKQDPMDNDPEDASDEEDEEEDGEDEGPLDSVGKGKGKGKVPMAAPADKDGVHSCGSDYEKGERFCSDCGGPVNPKEVEKRWGQAKAGRY